MTTQEIESGKRKIDAMSQEDIARMWMCDWKTDYVQLPPVELETLMREIKRRGDICQSAHAYIGAYREELRLSDTGLVGWEKMMSLLESGYKG